MTFWILDIRFWIGKSVAWRGFQSGIRNQKSKAENELGLRPAASARRNYTTLGLKEQQAYHDA
jgi:hypothetical protein